MENANDFIALEGAATRQCLAILHLPPTPSHQSLALEHEKNRMPSFPPPAGAGARKSTHTLSQPPLAGAGARKSLHTLSPTTSWRFFFTLKPVAFGSQVMCCKASPCSALNKKLVNNLLITTRHFLDLIIFPFFMFVKWKIKEMNNASSGGRLTRGSLRRSPRAMLTAQRAGTKDCGREKTYPATSRAS